MQNTMETGVQIWWKNLSNSEKFNALPLIDNIEEFSKNYIDDYAKAHTSGEIFYKLTEDKEGSEILKKYQLLTDDIMDIAFIHNENHFWNQNLREILHELFISSEKWFLRIHNQDILPIIVLISEPSVPIANSKIKRTFLTMFKTVGGILKVIFLLAVGYVMYSGIPAIILFFGISIDRAFDFNDAFLWLSFFVIFIYFIYLGNQYKRR